MLLHWSCLIIGENDETFIAKSHQPIPLQKKSNEKQFPRKFSRNQSYHKKAVLRRDLLAESSEEFLSILHSASMEKDSYSLFLFRFIFIKFSITTPNPTFHCYFFHKIPSKLRKREKRCVLNLNLLYIQLGNN